MRATVDRKTLVTVLGWAKAVAGLGMGDPTAMKNVRVAVRGMPGGKVWSGLLEISVLGWKGEMRVDLPCKAEGEGWERVVGIFDLVKVAKQFKSPKLQISPEGETGVGLAGPNERRKPVVVVPNMPDPPLEFSDHKAPERLGNAMRSIFRATPLARILGRVLPAASRDVSRSHMQFVDLETEAGVIRAVAMDGHRMHIARELVSHPRKDWPAKVGIATDWARVLYSILDRGRLVGMEIEDEMSMGVGDCSLFFRLNYADGVGVWLAVPKCEGSLPDWARVTPARFDTRLVVNRSPLVSALQMAKKVAGVNNGVKLDAVGGKFTLWVEVDGEVRFSEDMDCWHKGREFKSGYNAAYLLDYLLGMKSATVSIQANGVLDPIRLDPGKEASDDFWAIVMPMRV